MRLKIVPDNVGAAIEHSLSNKWVMGGAVVIAAVGGFLYFNHKAPASQAAAPSSDMTAVGSTSAPILYNTGALSGSGNLGGSGSANDGGIGALAGLQTLLAGNAQTLALARLSSDHDIAIATQTTQQMGIAEANTANADLFAQSLIATLTPGINKQGIAYAGHVDVNGNNISFEYGAGSTNNNNSDANNAHLKSLLDSGSLDKLSGFTPVNASPVPSGPATPQGSGLAAVIQSTTNGGGGGSLFGFA